MKKTWIKRLVNLLLKNSHWFVRRPILHTLEKIGGKRRVLEPLRQALQDTDRHVRRSAVHKLGKGDGEQVVETLCQALQDTDSSVRIEAVEALTKIGGKQVIEPLHQALEDADRFVRLLAIHGLRKIESEQVIEPLHYALEDADEDIRYVAKGHLEKIMSFVDTIFFGDFSSTTQRQKKIIWHNPHISEQTIRLPKLQYIVVDAKTCDVKHLERFMTYAVNTIGQNYLKQHVTVYIWGGLAQKSQNTYNAFNNLCQKIVEVESKNSLSKMLGVAIE